MCAHALPSEEDSARIITARSLRAKVSKEIIHPQKIRRGACLFFVDTKTSYTWYAHPMNAICLLQKEGRKEEGELLLF